MPQQRPARTAPAAPNQHAGTPVETVVGLVNDLLMPSASDDGLVVALADDTGHLRHIGGDRRAQSRIEEIGFAVGENWSQAQKGTNAPGTSLLRGSALSVKREEHTRPEVHAFSCSAAPLVHPSTGAILGTLDVTGGDAAADPRCLALVRATAAAAARELSIQMRDASALDASRTPPSLPTLRLVHRGRPCLEAQGTSTPLTTRHTELLTVLATEPGGLTAGEIGALVYPEQTAAATVRVELLRLKRLLDSIPGAPQLAGRPYRLTEPLAIDALEVVEHVGRGEYDLALDLYRGESVAAAESDRVSAMLQSASLALREAMLSDADPDTLLRYLELPEVEADPHPWQVALQVLPARSAQRSVIVAHLETLQSSDIA